MLKIPRKYLSDLDSKGDRCSLVASNPVKILCLGAFFFTTKNTNRFASLRPSKHTTFPINPISILSQSIINPINLIHESMRF